jgi:transcriptional regulator with XRE-family HTH domain
MTTLSEKITGLREAKGIYSTQLAQSVPIAKGYLSSIEHGKNPDMRVSKISGFAKALDVRVDYLMDESIETRSWKKVAADESLELFLKRGGLSEEDKVNLRRISFTEDSPLTLKEWEQFWNRMKVFNGPAVYKYQPRTRPQTRKNLNPGN